MPPAALATTGTAQAIASSAARPNDSVADGRAPALAGLLREALEALLPDELESWAEIAQQLRAHWKADGVAIARRRPLLLRALNELYREAA